MKLTNFEKLFDICKELSENHIKYGLDKFNIQISVNLDRTYFIALYFLESIKTITIAPDSKCSVDDWFFAPIYWVGGRYQVSIITDWIVKNKEVFGIPLNDEVQNEMTSALEDMEFRRGEVLPKRLK